jgi:glycosyltransferase involved in cell wall biosynthesis
MPKHVYNSLSLEPLIKTSIIIQLVDPSFVYPLVVIEDVLVKIDSLVILCDFYILDMDRESCDSSNNNTPILFGRPFLKTANTKIDCGQDILSMEVGDEKIEFNFHDAMKYPYNNVYSIIYYDQVDKYVQQVFYFDCENTLSVALSYGCDFTEIKEMERHIYVSQNIQESALALQTAPCGNVFVGLVLSYKKLLPFILQALKLELKPFPDNLKYVFIGDNNTLHAIIAKGLTSA